MMDYYTLLEVERNASASDIKKAYRSSFFSTGSRKPRRAASLILINFFRVFL